MTTRITDEVDGRLSKRDKIKDYLTSKVVECEKIIKKRKKKNKIIKILYFSLITTSTVGSSVVIILSSLTVPPLIIASVSGVTTITSALSIKFSLQDKKISLNKIFRIYIKLKTN